MPRLLSVSLLGLALMSACRSPTFPELNDTFDGVLQPQGADWHQFVVQHPGDVNITVTKFEPLSTATFGVGIGVIDGTKCVVTTGTDTGRVNATGLASAGAGTYCVQLYDTGNVTQTVTYTVKVRHF
jgi:hypothetical protein